MRALCIIVWFVGLFFLWSIAPSYAADPALPITATLTAQKDSDYTLPYPGLLPDNPFYGVKMLRDRIIGFLIANPQKKAEFDLLQADKRLQGGAYLLYKDTTKANLALATIAKGQQYFDDAFLSLEKAKEQKFAVTELEGRLLLAAHKHQQVLTDLEPSVPKSEKSYYRTILKKSDELFVKAKAISRQ
jgi:hypothetical protein